MSVPPQPLPPAATAAPKSGEQSAPAVAAAEKSFFQRHSRIINALFFALCVYVALIWLLALDQKFHWGIFGPTPLPRP